MTPQDHRSALAALLAWQVELGADEAICDAPVDRLNAPEPEASPAPQQAAQAQAPAPLPPAQPSAPDPAALAAATTTLEELAGAMRAMPSPLSAAARSFVFSDGQPGAPVMIIGEAPGAEEDREGKPFVGRAGQLLDRMLAAIGLARDAEDLSRAVYIVNILPWRPPGNRTPSTEEASAFLPFVQRHIQLAAPRLLFSIGNTPTKALLDTQTGIKRMRGTWQRHGPTGLPLLPSFHPAYLLRQPGDKRLAWTDLLMLADALENGPPAMTDS